MKRILTTILAGGVWLAAMAIPAKPGFVAYTQSDGSVINVKLVGDEYGHMIYSESGRLLVESNGFLEYASFDSDGFPVASGIRVSNDGQSLTLPLTQSPEKLEKWKGMLNSMRSKRLEKIQKKSYNRIATTRSDDAEQVVPKYFGRFDTSFPVFGEQKLLVILVEYADVPFKFQDAGKSYFNRMLNEEGFSDYGSLGSARDWFIENSGGRFIPTFDVFGPVKLPHNRAYYGNNDISGSDIRPHEMVIDACSLLDDEIDFSAYDMDGDGIVDNVFIVYADLGEHDSGKREAVWPHSYDLTFADPFKKYIHDGVQIDHYACVCEYPSGYSRPDGIGTFVHEFSHVMGLPDLYQTVPGTAFTPGYWSVMDYGPYNNDRLTPPNYSSYEKCALGWIEMLPFNEGKLELPDLSVSNVAYALPTENKDEFFFFENRQQIGNDEFLPGHGMLVWHVDYNKDIWDKNVVNNNKSHQYVDLVEADLIPTDATRKGDPFPGTKKVTSYGFDTTPKLQSWAGLQLAYDLRDITEEDGLISFYAVSNGDNAVIGIEGTDQKDDIYYDLAGRKILNPGKGIYIRNGKKIILK